MEFGKAVWHTVVDFILDLISDKPWREEGLKNKFKALRFLLLVALLGFIYYLI